MGDRSRGQLCQKTHRLRLPMCLQTTGCLHDGLNWFSVILMRLLVHGRFLGPHHGCIPRQRSHTLQRNLPHALHCKLAIEKPKSIKWSTHQTWFSPKNSSSKKELNSTSTISRYVLFLQASPSARTTWPSQPTRPAASPCARPPRPHRSRWMPGAAGSRRHFRPPLGSWWRSPRRTWVVVPPVHVKHLPTVDGPKYA